MIPPITREEKYMYEIVGAGETAPEKPLTRKEIFYAVILGEDRTVPRPITNEEKYLSAFLAAAGGQQVSVPEPVTRKEQFLYALCDKAYQPPRPITREEKFMSEVIEYIRTHGGTVTHTVSYYNYDGTELLYSETVVDGEDAAGYEGETPTKAETAQYTYSFVGWSETAESSTADIGVLENITADKSVYAAFEPVEKTFTVTFYNGTSVVYTALNVAYNSTAVYGGATPTKESTQQYSYNFIGWNTDSSASTADADALKNVTANRTVYAIFEQVVRGYTVYFYNGDTLLQTVENVPEGGTATYTGATPTSSQAGYIFSGWSPSNTNITADTSCYAQFVDEDMYESISDTWSEIIANVSNGTYSTKYHIGDTKKIDLGTEGEIIMQIVALDTDLLADNSGKAPMTWISKQLLKTSHRMNPSYSPGTEGTGTLGGWAACEMRNYLINTIKPLLPSEVRNALKTVKKYSEIYNTSETAVNNVVSNDDIWIPSAYEVNYTDYETSGVTYSTAFPDNASRIKHKVSGSATWWWLRSASRINGFRVVSSDGSYTGNSAYNSSGVVVGFCT